MLFRRELQLSRGECLESSSNKQRLPMLCRGLRLKGLMAGQGLRSCVVVGQHWMRELALIKASPLCCFCFPGRSLLRRTVDMFAMTRNRCQCSHGPKARCLIKGTVASMSCSVANPSMPITASTERGARLGSGWNSGWRGDQMEVKAAKCRYC